MKSRPPKKMNHYERVEAARRNSDAIQGTTTGRWSSTQPNRSNKPSVIGKLCTVCNNLPPALFGTCKHDNCPIAPVSTFDYADAEKRVLATICESKPVKMVDVVLAGFKVIEKYDALPSKEIALNALHTKELQETVTDLRNALNELSHI